MRQHGDVAGWESDGVGVHRLGHGALGVGWDHAIVCRDDVPGGLFMPGCGGDGSTQHFGVGWSLGGSDLRFFCRGEVLSEVLRDTFRSEL